MNWSRKMRRKHGRESTRKLVDSRSVLAFDVRQVPKARPEMPKLTPEERQLTKLYATFATNVWRLKRQILDAETGEPKEGFERVARYVTSMEGALEDAHVKTVDYDGRPYDEGDAVKVITFESRADLKRDEYVETLLPTVQWTNAEGKMTLLQMAEVVVGQAPQKEDEQKEQDNGTEHD